MSDAGLLAEIRQQPEMMRAVVGVNEPVVAAIAARFNLESFSHITIAARGTSDNAARYAKYLWGAANQVSVGLAAPSLYTTYQQPPSLRDALVVGISQSGESPDLVAVLTEAQKQGRPTLAITNQPQSPMGRVADLVLDLQAGEEHAVAATKTFTAQLLATAMLSLAWRQQGMDKLRSLSALVEDVLAENDSIAQVAERFVDLEACAVLGRGFNHSTAYEWALKLQEVTYVLAQPYSTADFRHGPIAVVDRGFPVFAIAADGPVFDDTLTMLTDLDRGKQAELLVISNREEAKRVATHHLNIPAGTPEWLSPIVSIVAGQLFTYHLGKARGLDTEAPRGLSKVTRTI